jgi:hypothetical protein
MSDTAAITEQKLQASRLGGPGPADPKLCSTAAIDALLQLAGADISLNSLQLEVSSKPLGLAEVVVGARIDKRTRSIAFVSCEAMSGDEMVFRAQGLFSAKR